MIFPKHDENGDYITDPPQSRIEQRLARIEKLIEEGGGGGGDAETASEEDIDYIKDHTWGDDSNASGSNDVGQGSSGDSDDDETASDDDIQGIKDGIWGD